MFEIFSTRTNPTEMLERYFEIDVTIIRLGWVLLTLLGVCGILAYIIALIIIPKEW